MDTQYDSNSQYAWHARQYAADWNASCGVELSSFLAFDL